MFGELFDKLNTFAHHHQVLFALIVGFCFISISWGVEKFLEDYVFPKRTLTSYFIVIVGGLFLLWITQHFILRAV